MSKIIGTVKFLDTLCNVHLEKYMDNDRPAITLTVAETGEPMAVATVNYSSQHMPEGYAAFKTWSENEGLILVLQDAGIVGRDMLTTVESGFVSAPVYEIVEYTVTYEVYEGQEAYDIAKKRVNSKDIPWDDLGDVNSLWDYVDGQHTVSEIHRLADEAYADRLDENFPGASDIIM